MQHQDSLTRLKDLFRELFQLDTADLDFGLYRLFRIKRAEIEAFLDKQLPSEVEKAFASVADADRGNLQKELEGLAKKARDDVSDDAILPSGEPNPEHAGTKAVKKYIEARKRLEAVEASEAQRAEVFNQLYAFFSRYYDEGDFIPRRFFGARSAYAVPYNGEEVFFHWANKDQYYVKSGETFRDYTFTINTLQGEYRVRVKLTADPAVFLRELNVFRAGRADFMEIPIFTQDDLRRLAFFMATGSGKTLLLHVNILQILHYLKTGKHPEALIRRSDGRTEFDNILLITPGEGLSAQHLAEFEDSGIDAGRFERNGNQGGLFGPRVSVIEIHKLADLPSGEGVSIPIAELGTRNLIIVDEGHKGTGTEARTWKSRQEALSRDGFLFEYSATFAQAIGSASRKVQEELLSTYGKSILFDYSYRYFYGDG
jgi:hypothetical protein